MERSPARGPRQARWRQILKSVRSRRRFRPRSPTLLRESNDVGERGSIARSCPAPAPPAHAASRCTKSAQKRGDRAPSPSGYASGGTAGINRRRAMNPSVARTSSTAKRSLLRGLEQRRGDRPQHDQVRTAGWCVPAWSGQHHRQLGVRRGRAHCTRSTSTGAARRRRTTR